MTTSNKPPYYDYAIIGLGAAGLNLALSMAENPFFKDKKVLLLDKDIKEANDRTWCFWEKGEGKWDGIISNSWQKIKVASQKKMLEIPLHDYRYKMLNSKNFYRYCLDKLASEKAFTIVTAEVKETIEHEDYVEIKCNEISYDTAIVFSSILDYRLPETKHPMLWQHFGGWFIQTEKAYFSNQSPEFMNFSIPQDGRTQFMYVLPVTETEALFEYTIFSEKLLKREEYENYLQKYLEDKSYGNYKITDKEFGEIPMTTYPFWNKNTRRKMYIGSAGGWTKPSTGYTFYFCQKYAGQLAKFLTTGQELTRFTIKNRYFWYDLILLKVLERNNHLGAGIFTNMFEKNKIDSIFRFLHHESNLWEDLNIICKTKHHHLFFLSFLQTLIK
jgi:lycopene beta-cyclase